MCINADHDRFNHESQNNANISEDHHKYMKQYTKADANVQMYSTVILVILMSILPAIAPLTFVRFFF